MPFIRSVASGALLSLFLHCGMWAQTSNLDSSTSPAPVPSKQKASDDNKQPSLALTNPFDTKKSQQDNSMGELEPGADPDNRLVMPFVKHLAGDQYSFWTAPAHFQVKDLQWIAPLAGVTAGFMAGDSWISKQIPLGEVNRSKTFSNYATYSLIGAGAGSFLLGHLTGDDRMSEAGLLSGEAAINSGALAYLLKGVIQRQRPYQANGNGAFFQGGSSFPSEHAAIAWSIASVMAHEYPGPLTKILAYGLATGISATRVTGQQHFASDVIVGSALGWYFGRQVYRAHHDTDLGGDSWGSVLPESSGEKTRNPENMGSPYVPLDSWVYPALERLIALGYIKDAFLGIRPWTRIECTRMLEEASERIGDDDDQSNEAARIYAELAKEFAPESSRLDGAENLGASIDSVYARFTGISGQPLRDGYHFGQTIINDYGRPYGEGFNSADGITAHAEAGPFAFFIRGEYQHAPAIVSDGSAVLQAIADADLTTPISNARSQVDRFDLVEGTVSMNWHNAQLSFGKQSLWLGPGESGALLMSNNAEPVMMIKLESVSPYRVPLLSHVLGSVHTEYFLGQLAGHQFEFDGDQLLGSGGIVPQPFLDGGKVSFKPTANLEIGMGFTAQFAGPDLPFTFSNFIRTFYVHTQNTSTTTGNNPAKRITSADFTYRVPGLRNWLTVYGDALTVDEISPIGSSRATVNPGIYVPQFPKLHNLELRAEGLHEPLTSEFAPGFVYYGVRRYRSGYTNDGTLMGSWIGRAGRGGQGWLTYSFSPRSRLELGYRLQEVSHNFIEGGRSADYSVDFETRPTSLLSFRGSFQYEQWRFPIFASGQQSDVTAQMQVTFCPNLRIRR